LVNIKVNIGCYVGKTSAVCFQIVGYLGCSEIRLCEIRSDSVEFYGAKYFRIWHAHAAEWM